MQELTEAHEIADSIARLSDVDAALEFRSLPKNLGLEVFEELEPFDQQRLLSGMREDAYHQSSRRWTPTIAPVCSTRPQRSWSSARSRASATTNGP